MKSLRDKKIIIETMLCWKNEGMIGSMLTTNYLLNISRQDAMKVFAKSEHTCQKLEGREHTKCMLRYKEMAMRELIMSLSNNKTKCNQTKDPASCKIKIDNRIEKAEEKLNKYQEKITLLQREKI